MSHSCVLVMVCVMVKLWLCEPWFEAVRAGMVGASVERLVWGGWVVVAKVRLVGKVGVDRVGKIERMVCPWAMVCIGGLRVLMAVPIMPVGGILLVLADS